MPTRRALAACSFLFLACLGKDQTAVAPPPPSVFDPLSYNASGGNRLAFGVQAGPIRNYFFRQGPAAAHLSTRSGQNPRVIAAFPANDQGIGVWFSALPEGTELFVGSGPDGDAVKAGGGLSAIVREGGDHDLHGVRAMLHSTAKHLSTELVLLGNVRTLRDYGSGVCLEDKSKFPELRNETLEFGDGQVLRIRREQVGGGHSMELLLAGTNGTSLALRPREAAARSACTLGEGGGQAIIDINGGEGGIELSLIALASDEPLTPIEADDLFVDSPPEGPALDALTFLSYQEKWLAGSWRFLSYFGRDTLLSLWMMLPRLQPDVVFAALGSVLERVQLQPGVAAPEGGTIELGDVAHEEEIGDYAAWKNQKLTPPPADLRQPRYDYQMVDDDFMLAPLLAASIERLSPPRRKGTPPVLPPSIAQLLQKKRSDGHTYEEAALANLALVLRRAAPFADDTRPPAEKKQTLVALHENASVGDWRDSEAGLAFGRYPFDVNAALVPGALAAARAVYDRLGHAPEAAEATRMGKAWVNIEQLFAIEQPLETAKANVQSYAAAVGLADVSSALEPEPGATPGVDLEYGIALDAALNPLPVQHSDHSFVLAFARPSEAYLRHVAARLVRPFPAGLASPVGVMVANPAFAAPELTVVDPKRRDDANDDVATPLRDLFTAARYHGTVVWSWQQALLAAGLRRQLSRTDINKATRTALLGAECVLWRGIEATREHSTNELWSWAPNAEAKPEFRPFGAGSPDADESNAIQLWSTVFLAVQRPTPAQNPRCRATGAGP